ncbi:ABC transporter substrate-binding protein [Phytohalomonas tamaricis]|uniref:ABC transporter substrate-binding protein n=1 Tax=Phytohalomonas tamaricis TaxID=2081032 RepID=UPI000D0B0F01|nr:ABC transporter substrate-binding protein [Phytohalomonas tamaricis]
MRALIGIGILVFGILALPMCKADALHEEGYPRTVTDITGRHVTLKHRPTRVFLTQPRQLYTLAILLRDPVKRLAGWAYPLDVYDPAATQLFTRQWPELEKLPALSQTTASGINNEALISLAPDLVLFDLTSLSSVENSSLATTLNSLGIPYLFIDFNQHPLENTPASLMLLGRALDVEAQADSAVDLIGRHLALIDQRLATVSDRPDVLINVAPGLKIDCCRTNLSTGLADLVARAGGHNAAASLVSAQNVTLSTEWVLSHAPDTIINTAGLWSAGGGIRAGIDVDEQEIETDLHALTSLLPGWSQLDAVKQGHFYALWHGFHQGPFAIVALEQIAKWLHPDLFSDLQPEETFKALLSTTTPLTPTGRFWASLPAQTASSHTPSSHD